MGPFKQAENGFRIHTAMFRVKWAARGAEEKILELKRGRRRRARAAFEHLMAAEESEYRVFTAKHKKFLRRHPEATEHERKRPLQYIETTGLECALWPHLYWATEMTETGERNTDSRRLHAGRADRTRKRKRKRRRPNGTASSAASCARSWGPSSGTPRTSSFSSSCTIWRSGRALAALAPVCPCDWC